MGHRSAGRYLCRRRVWHAERRRDRRPTKWARHLSRRAPAYFVFILLVFRAADAAAQGSIWIDGTTSTAQPPADVVDAKSSAYVLLGLRVDLPRQIWKLGATASLGNGVGHEEGRWLWLDAAATRTWYGNRFSFALTSTGFALRYSQPFEYNAYAAELQPTLTGILNSIQISVSPRATFGFWQGDTLDGDIGVLGGAAQLTRIVGGLTGSVVGEAYHATNGALNGTFKGVGVEANLTLGSLQLGGGVKRWRNPVESEWGYSAFLAKSITPGFELHLQLARSVTDPVLASPGSLGASVGVSWRVVSARGRTARPVADVGAARQPGRLVVFTVAADAQTVALSGSFSDWTPIPMRRNGKSFTLELVVRPGTHQFGFLLDGEEWFVPKNASGLVDDGFGRQNATLVVEPQ